MLNKRNLKLGYGGTKTEMERLLKDAEKLSGQKYNIKNLSDVYEAIHVIQEEMGVTETTAEEASVTISGSANAMKAAFDNFLNGSGSPEQLAMAVQNFATNIFAAIQSLAPNILSGIVTLMGTLIPQISTLLMNLIPQLLTAITNMTNQLFDLISKNKEAIRNTVTELVKNFVTFLTDNLPTIIEMGLVIILALATGIGDALRDPEFIESIVECIVKICDILIENLDEIIAVALYIILALGEGIIKYLGKLLEPAIEAVKTIWQGIVDAKDKMVDAAKTLIENFKTGIINKIKSLKEAAKELVTGLWENIKSFITETDWLELGKNILKGILNGLLNFGTIVKDTVKKVGKKITNEIKDFFGIESPSKLMKKEVGQYLAKGIAVGFEDEIPSTIRKVNSAMANLNNGIQSSLNPTINPTANSNPLIIQIDNFNNTRNQDIQALAEELEFYRKNSALARGGN